MDNKHAYYAYIATLIAMVIIVFIVAILAYNKAYVEALGIGGVLTGLIGVLGTFKPQTTRGTEQADANLATALDKLPPQTTGTGPATPVETSE